MPVDQPTEARFVGRERELALLLQRLELAAANRGGVALVGGAPGIGKTRLLVELSRRVSQSGWRVLTGHAYESEGAPPYLPLTEALREYVRSVSADTLRTQLGEGAPDVAKLVREINALFPALPPSPALGEYERFRLFENLSDFLCAIARDADAGLLLVLDDLQWADRPTLLFVEHLTRRTADVPLVVAGTYRTVDLDRSHPLTALLASVGRDRTHVQLLLAPFTRAEAMALFAGITGSPPLEDLAAAVYRETEGNPFFVEEVVRRLQEEGCDMSAVATAQHIPIPERVQRVIEQRLGRLEAGVLRMLQAAAVLGRGFTPGVLSTVSGLDALALEDALDAALSAGLLQESAGLIDFTHALIRQTVYEGLNAARRVRLHRAAGAALEVADRSGADLHLAELATHFGESDRPEDLGKAASYARRAGDRAQALYAYEEGVRLYRMALQALERGGLPLAAERGEILLALGEARRRAGDLRAAMETFQEAATVARMLGAAELLSGAALGFEDALVLTGEPRGPGGGPSALLSAEALAALGDHETPLRARLLAAHAQAVYFGGDRDRGTELSLAAVRLAGRTGDQAALAYALAAHRATIWGPDNVQERLAIATQLTSLGAAVNDHALALQGSYWRVRALLELGEVTAAAAELDAYQRLVVDTHQPRYRLDAVSLELVRAMMEGRFDAAQTLTDTVQSLGVRLQDSTATAFALAQQLQLARELGGPDERAALAPAVLAHTRATGSFRWRAMLALLYAEMGRQADAQAEFDALAAQSFRDIEPNFLWRLAATAAAELCAQLGNERRASELYALLAPHAELFVTEVGSVGSVHRHLGLLAACLRRWDTAVAHFEAAAKANERTASRPALAHTLRAHAALLIECREREGSTKAIALLERAAVLYEELGMARWAEETAELLDRARASTAPHRAPAYPDSLTAREVEVLRLIAGGSSNQEIAGDLVLSVRTVERHVTNLYAKIAARGRADATAYAMRHGLTEG
jgi:DNA-binding CsgD family transcriptional regulator